MLKKIRESKNISQSEIAKLSGVSVQLIHLYEQKPERIKNAKLITLIKIAKALECSVSDLVPDLNLKNL